MTDDIQFWRADEWTMVYLNGELVCHGDHYHADEWLQARCGVVTVDDDDNASIPDGHHPLHLLAEAEENRKTAAELKRAIEAKREKARRLLEEAAEMEAQ